MLIVAPSTIVLLFGGDYSLVINLVAILCLFFLSVALIAMGEEYETPKRLLYTAIGASLAITLQVLENPGIVTIIIGATIFLIGAADIIHRGEILWLKFRRGARVGTLGKLIFLATGIFILMMIVANFGSQKIWLPIAAMALLCFFYIHKEEFMYFDNVSDAKLTSTGILVAIGVISTSYQFFNTELFLGIRLWQLVLAIVLILIITFIIMAIISNISIKADEKKKKEEDAQRNERIEKEAAEKAKAFNAIMEKAPETLSTADFIAIYNHNKQSAVYPFLQSSIDGEYIAELLTISVNKKQLIWQNGLGAMLGILQLVADKSFSDEELNRVNNITASIRKKVSDAKAKGKDELMSYKGEKELLELLTKIDSATAANN